MRIGTCSWADKGLLESWYPRGVSTAEKRLRYYAERFDVVEVDSPYYALPDPDGDGAMGTPDTGRVHVPREGVRRDDLARGRADR